MSKQNKLSKINFYDKLNAAFVKMITPEMAKLNEIRKRNSYSHKPTFKKPYEMPIEFFSIDNVLIRMSKNILNKKKKETIVLLSAFPHSIIAYSPIWEKLKKEYNLYTYDLPGFGASESKAEYMNFEYQAKFLNSFLKVFEIEEAHIVAPDVGMATALTYITSFDNKIKSLMVGDGPGAYPTIEPSIMKKMVHSGFWRSMFVMAGSGALIESAKNLGNLQYVPNEIELSDYKKSYKGKVSNAMMWFKQYPEAVKTLDSKLSNIKTPTKIFWGEFEAILNKENGINLSKKIANSELVIFNNCGHFVYQDDYNRFIKLIQSWVNKHS